MTFLPAYEARTGKKLPNYVPEHWFDDPTWGRTIRRTPRSQGRKGEAKASAEATTTPANGDTTESE